MKERRGVDELGRATGSHHLLHVERAGAPGQHREQRPQPLAASPEQMRADFGNAADGAVHLFA